MDRISFIGTYKEGYTDKIRKVKFDLTLVKDGTTTIIYGQMKEKYRGKTSVAGCAILSPEDTYNEVTGIKTAFKNMVNSAPALLEEEARQLYSYFRKLIYFLPKEEIKIDHVMKLEPASV